MHRQFKTVKRDPQCNWYCSVKDPNIFQHPSKVTARRRELRNGHSGCVIWMTGLSGAGKSTLATELESESDTRIRQSATRMEVVLPSFGSYQIPIAAFGLGVFLADHTKRLCKCEPMNAREIARLFMALPSIAVRAFCLQNVLSQQ